jgi:hypothetical protein
MVSISLGFKTSTLLKSQNGEADWLDHFAQRAGASGQRDQVIASSSSETARTE